MKRSAETAHLFFDNREAWSGASSSRSTFKVNFRDLLGNMYNKYSKFLIVLNSHSAFAPDWTNAAGTAVNVYARMSGLNWEHSSYGILTAQTYQNNVMMRGNNEEAVFPQVFNLADNGVTTFNSSINTGLCFRKPTEEFTTLAILFRDIRSNKDGSSIPDGFGYQYLMSFTIYGLYDA